MADKMVATGKKTVYSDKLLFGRGGERVLTGKSLDHCAMPLGPIGCGSVSMAGRGHLSLWRVLGQATGLARAPLTFFAVRAKSGGKSTARLLQLDKAAGLPPVKDVEFVGEFPLARLRYLDRDLPLDIVMEAFSPFMPPDSRASCTPGVAFTFTVKNTGKKTAEVSLLSSMLNIIGHDSMATLRSASHPGFGGNANSVRRQAGSTAIVMSVEEPPATSVRPDVVFEDFESGTYRKWTVKGKAFGKRPSKVGDVIHAGQLTGSRGQYLADSMPNSKDEAVGKLTSETFKIERDYIHFLIGGGSLPGKTCINLRVAGKVVRTATGENSARLVRKHWDVRDLADKNAMLEIVDAAATKGAHVMVDHVVFSDTVPVVPEEAFCGTMCLATTAAGATHAAQWTDVKKVWADFVADGALEPTAPKGPTKAGRTCAGALAVPFSLAPGRSKRVTFFVTWHFPNRMSEARRGAHRIGMAYNNWFADAPDVLDHFVGNYASLYGGTKAFHDTLYNTSLPHWLIDLIGSQLAVLPSPTCVWCENDDFGLWEGVCAAWCGQCGSCGVNCMHVLNYSMIPGILFPDRERAIRRLNVKHQQGEDGRFYDKYYSGFPPYRPSIDNIDNSCGFPLKVYRDYLWSGDKGALDVFWPEVKRVMAWLISRDLDGDGIPNMRREPGSYKAFHTTFDEWTMYGTSSFIGSYWLAALLAAEQMALIEGEPRTAATYRKLFDQAHVNFDKQLWNGEYYKFFHDPHYDKERLTDYDQCCLSDQMIGQWYGYVLGLGRFLPKAHIDSALDAVFRYNWFDDYEYESKVTGPKLCIYTHPRGKYRTYGEFKMPKEDSLVHGEVDGHYRNWTGAEMAAAAHMIYEGLLDKGLTVARGVFDRYDGARANPWMHIECGAYYSRGMSSWTLLLAASGHRYDAARGFVAFAPAFTPDNFRSFFSGFGGWGTFTQRRKGTKQIERLDIKHGAIEIKELAFALPAEHTACDKAITLKLGNGRVRGRLTRQGSEARIVLDERVTLHAGDALELGLDIS